MNSRSSKSAIKYAKKTAHTLGDENNNNNSNKSKVMQIRSPSSAPLYNRRGVGSPLGPGSLGSSGSSLNTPSTRIRVVVIGLLLGIVLIITVLFSRDTGMSSIFLMMNGAAGGGPVSSGSSNVGGGPSSSGKVRFVKMESWSGASNSLHGKNKNLHSSSTKALTFVRYRIILDDDNTNPNNKAHSKNTDDGNVEPQYLSYKDWLAYVSSIGETGSTTTNIGTDIMEAFSRVLRVEVPYKAYRFETPPVTSNSISTTPFEFVIVEDNYLAQFAAHADYEPFLNQLQLCNEDRTQPGCAFENLKGDATLIAPRDVGRKVHHTHTFYGHLAAFMNNAPEHQMIGMWKLAAQTIQKKLSSDDPLWFSTAGTGVAWLHFRLDSRPKYYTYEPFKQFKPTNNLP